MAALKSGNINFPCSFIVHVKSGMRTVLLGPGLAVTRGQYVQASSSVVGIHCDVRLAQ